MIGGDSASLQTVAVVFAISTNCATSRWSSRTRNAVNSVVGVSGELSEPLDVVTGLVSLAAARHTSSYLIRERRVELILICTSKRDIIS